MPNVAVTTAQIAWAGGSLTTIPAMLEITPAHLTCEGGFVVAGPGTGVNFDVPSIGYLGRLQRTVPITEQGGPEKMNLSGRPTMQEQIRQKKYAEAQEKVVTALADQVGDNATLLAAVLEAQKQAQIAADTANTVKKEQNLTNSRVEPMSVLTANSDGSIAIAAHSRIYGDGTTVAVDAGSVSGFSFGEFVRISYQDAAREGGVVAFEGTTGDVVQTGNTHVVGGVTIPDQGEPPATGEGPSPPGYIQDPNDFR